MEKYGLYYPKLSLLPLLIWITSSCACSAWPLTLIRLHMYSFCQFDKATGRHHSQISVTPLCLKCHRQTPRPNVSDTAAVSLKFGRGVCLWPNQTGKNCLQSLTTTLINFLQLSAYWMQISGSSASEKSIGQGEHVMQHPV